MAYDPHRGVVYVATGSPKPNFIGVRHRGDNLYSNCAIAVNATTGEKLWHFQEIPHDICDLDIPSPPILVNINLNEKSYDAVAFLTKIGNTVLLDRLTGKPIFPMRYRRAPTSLLPGEQTAPYQPDSFFPQPFARQKFSRDDVTDISEEAR